MKRPDERTVFAVSVVQKQHPEVLTYLEQWLDEELSKLPYTTGNTAVAQGRCQVLTELCKLMSNASEYAADLERQRRSTHTDRSV